MMSNGFRSAAQALNGTFGTETAAPLLYALARFVRPRRIFEVGAGLSTLYLLQALADSAADDHEDRSSDRNVYGKTSWYDRPYAPRLMTLDDQSHGQNKVERLLGVVDDLGLAPYLDLRRDVFEGYAAKLSDDMLPLDLVWFDCGGLEAYVDFTLEYWPLVNPNGGLIAYHSTLTNAELRVFTEVLINRQRASGEFELINLLEPHKKMQNSMTILRRRSGRLSTLYTWEP
jgi:hypothetical protein